MRTVKQINDAIWDSGRITQDCTKEEAAEFLLALKNEAWNNKMTLSVNSVRLLSDIAWSMASPQQRKIWEQWSNTVTETGPDLDISSAASVLGKKGGASKSNAKKKSSRDNGRLGGRPKKEKE